MEFLMFGLVGCVGLGVYSITRGLKQIANELYMIQEQLSQIRQNQR